MQAKSTCHTCMRLQQRLDRQTGLKTGHVADLHFPLMCAMLLTASEESVMVLIAVLCPHCHSDQVIKGGRTKAGQQRY